MDKVRSILKVGIIVKYCKSKNRIFFLKNIVYILSLKTSST